ncbi:anthranilate phosphoribosyltransferase [Defluviitalea phaphyphila]|uniref:anthranilate phosphoribosyltransferase n=1 Tax=Defluviitalea phaphyphila TaxID=1473580 RepID=UPI00072FBA3F|nr:anthranilate phosphoribosyltransferase [Defluviitalea phaphyphila]
MLREAVETLLEGKDLTENQMIEAMESIMNGEATNTLIGSFLTALKIKGETPEEITGGAKVMRKKAEKIDLEGLYTLDTCGTGGDGAGTFNISTAVAFIAASAGIYVVKHGNRSVSSKSGSADVLEALGVNISLTPKQVEECIKAQNIGFLFAPTFHKAMKYALGPRKELGFRTIFNVLGPLTNPAEAKAQVMGVFDDSLTEIMARVLLNLGVEHAMVVHGMDGLDEITITDKTKVTELKNKEINTYFISPEQYGIEKGKKEDLVGGDAKENAEIIMNILKGEKGPKRDIVLLNSGAALYVGKKAKSIEEGINMAKKLIDEGYALNKLDEFREYTRRFL